MADIEAYIRNAALAGQRGSLQSIGQQGAANYGNLTTFVFITLFVSWLVFFTVFLILTLEDQNIGTNVFYGLSILVGLCVILVIVAYFSWLTNIGSYIYSRVLFGDLTQNLSSNVKALLEAKKRGQEEALRIEAARIQKETDIVSKAKEAAELEKAEVSAELKVEEINRKKREAIEAILKKKPQAPEGETS